MKTENNKINTIWPRTLVTPPKLFLKQVTHTAVWLCGRDQRDWVYSLKPEIEIYLYWVSILTPRRFSCSLNNETETFFQSLNFETEIETFFFKSRDRDLDCHWSQNRDQDQDFFKTLVHLWNPLSWVSSKLQMVNIKWVYSLKNRKIIYTSRFSGRSRYLPWLDSIHV